MIFKFYQISLIKKKIIVNYFIMLSNTGFFVKQHLQKINNKLKAKNVKIESLNKQLKAKNEKKDTVN